MPNSSRLLPVLVLALSAAFAGADASFLLAPFADQASSPIQFSGLSRDGSVALVRLQVGHGSRAYLWTPGSGLIERPGAPQVSSNFSVLSGDGKTFFGQIDAQAGFWSEGMPALALSVPAAASASFVNAASYDGTYAVGQVSDGGAGATRWNAGVPSPLTAGAGVSTYATGVSDAGVTVGFTFDHGRFVACRWDSSGGRADLPVPAEFATGYNEAIAITGDGSVILGHLQGATGSIGCLWERTRRREFGSFPGFEGSVDPKAISADGNVVVGSVSDSDASYPFIWDRAHGTRDLRGVFLRAGLGAELDGLRLDSATAVASLPSGEIVVGGEVEQNGALRAFVATIPAEASFEGIGDLDGGGFDSSATSLSADGMTVAGFGHTATGRRAFTWTHDRGLVDLGDGAIDARGVSEDGTAVAGLMADGAFRWNADGAGRWLGASARAEAISILGDVTVGSDLGPDGMRHAYRWNGDSTERYTTHIAGHVAPSEAHGVTLMGSTFVGSTLPHTANGVSYDERAFLWDADGRQRYLGDLPGGRVQSQALAISAYGDAVVGWSSSKNGPEAFRWTPVGGMRGLGDLPGYGFASRALAVSYDGSLVVGTGVVNGQNRAFLWDEENGMRDLRALLVASGAVEAQAWTLISATGVVIDRSGRIAVSGIGIDDQGRQQGFHASMPSLPGALRP